LPTSTPLQPWLLAIGVHREQREMFVRHADRLRELLRHGGWPTGRVSARRPRGAWLIAQHADTQLDVQRLAVRLLRAAVEAGEGSRRELAFLEDRVAVMRG
jgi:hypothetical protein